MADETGKTEQNKGKSLDKLTVKELRELALTLPHSTALHDMKKGELLALIREARGIQAEAPTSRPKKVAAKLKMTKAQLKAKIRELKDLKREAQETRDNKKAKALRHSISKLKKKTRNVAGT